MGELLQGLCNVSWGPRIGGTRQRSTLRPSKQASAWFRETLIARGRSPTIQHVVVLTFSPGLTHEQIDEL